MYNDNTFLNAFAQAIKPKPHLSVTEWAEQNRYLDSATAEPGLYRVARTPYMREIMDNFSVGSSVELTTFMKSAQVGGSEAINNITGYQMEYAPSSAMIIQPTIAQAEKYSKMRIQTMIELCPSLQALFAGNHKLNTILTKMYLGGVLNLVGANSASSLRSIAARNAMCDEIDAWENDVQGEGDPLDLIKRRLSSFYDSKMMECSTPTNQYSKIYKSFLKGDQRYYHVPCPHCGVLQKLVFDQLKFIYNKETRIVETGSTHYECEHCEGKIYDHHKTKMFNLGQWIPSNPSAPKTHRSYHINALYSPSGWKMSWHALAQEFLYSRHDPFKFKSFTNTLLGEIWKEKTEQPDYFLIKQRAENYSLTDGKLPSKDIIMIFGGCDVQDDRICVLLMGFGKNQEIWVLDYEEILGSPADQSTWNQVLNKVNRKFIHPDGVELKCRKAAIDTGGHFTDFVYDFVRINSDLFIGVKGGSHGQIGYMKLGSEIDKNRDGVAFDSSIQLHIVNTNLAKKTIYQFLATKEAGPKFVHTSEELEEEFYKMLTAEVIAKKIVNGHYVERFEKPTSTTRNEVLDCFVYGYCAARQAGVHDLYEENYNKAYNNIITKKRIAKENKEKMEKEIVENKAIPSAANIKEIRKKKNFTGGGDFFSSNL